MRSEVLDRYESLDLGLVQIYKHKILCDSSSSWSLVKLVYGSKTSGSISSPTPSFIQCIILYRIIEEAGQHPSGRLLGRSAPCPLKIHNPPFTPQWPNNLISKHTVDEEEHPTL